MDLGFKLDLPLEDQPDAEFLRGHRFDLVIVGGGPAGMTAAMYASRKQLDTILVSPDLGGQVLVTSGVENYIGYQYITGPELSQKFSAHIRQFPLKLLSPERVTAAAPRPDGDLQVTTDAGSEVRGRTLILATGKRWRKLGVPGEDAYLGRGVANCAVCDAPFFKGEAVAVVGGGNSAVTAAIDLLNVQGRVTVVNFSDGWQADPVLLERVRGRVDLLDAHRVLEVLGDGKRVTGVRIAPRDGGPERRLDVSGVFVEIGLLPNTELFRGFVDLNPQGEIVVDCATHTSRPGVYAAGDCTTVPEKQIVIAAGEGAKAALAAFAYLNRLP
jgi:NADH-dependent peroxiredoxin subunit F